MSVLSTINEIKKAKADLEFIITQKLQQFENDYDVILKKPSLFREKEDSCINKILNLSFDMEIK